MHTKNKEILPRRDKKKKDANVPARDSDVQAICIDAICRYFIALCIFGTKNNEIVFPDRSAGICVHGNAFVLQLHKRKTGARVLASK